MRKITGKQEFNSENFLKMMMKMMKLNNKIGGRPIIFE